MNSVIRVLVRPGRSMMRMARPSSDALMMSSLPPTFVTIGATIAPPAGTKPPANATPPPAPRAARRLLSAVRALDQLEQVPAQHCELVERCAPLDSMCRFRCLGVLADVGSQRLEPRALVGCQGKALQLEGHCHHPTLAFC